jgi:hypothetical protein
VEYASVAAASDSGSLLGALKSVMARARSSAGASER